MKRPLLWFGAVCFLVLALWGNTGDSQESPPVFFETWLSEQGAAPGAYVEFEDRVSSCDAVSEGLRLSVSEVTVRIPDSSEISFLPEQKLIFTTDQINPAPGDRLRFSGCFESFESARNPGNFDAKQYYGSHNTVGRIKDVKLLGWNRGSFSVRGMMHRLRGALRISCGRILGDKKGRILSAICLGEKSNLEQEWKNTYQEGGISHILAVSGLHVSMTGMGIFYMLRRLRLSYELSAFFSGMTASLYVIMAGGGISATRALVMFFLWLGAQVCGRKYDMITSVSVAAVLLLLKNPRAVKDASFLLSFGAVLTLAVLVPCVRETCGIRNRFITAVTDSACIFMGMLPVSLYFFYQVSPWSIPVNMAVAALMTPLMGTGMAAAAAGTCSLAVGTFLAAPSSYLLSLFELLCKLEQHLPSGVWVAGRPSAENIAVYYLLLAAAGLWTWKHRKEPAVAGKKTAVPGKRVSVCLVWLMTFCICISLMCHRSERQLRIVCLDVGQGDGALLMFPDGTSCLIDGGSSSVSKVWEYRISQTLKYYGVSKLDCLFLSHADSDHTNGVKTFLQEYEAGPDGRNVHGITLGSLVLPPVLEEDFSELKAMAAEHGITVLTMEAGDNIGRWCCDKDRDSGKFLCSTFRGRASWKLECLAPQSEALSGERNEDSMVLMVRYGNFRMLFTGDLEGEAEKRLADQQEELRADVLKVGHHGSKNGTSELFLSAVMPEVAVISSGENNRYGHPAPETIERLLEAGAEILETSQGGAVTVMSDGRTFQAESFADQDL